MHKSTGHPRKSSLDLSAHAIRKLICIGLNDANFCDLNGQKDPKDEVFSLKDITFRPKMYQICQISKICMGTLRKRRKIQFLEFSRLPWQALHFPKL